MAGNGRDVGKEGGIWRGGQAQVSSLSTADEFAPVGSMEGNA